jgi:hypothetical protein
MKAGFVSTLDRVVLGVMTEPEREAIIQRERQRVVSEVYTKLREELAPLGVSINGSCRIYDDGRLRYVAAGTDSKASLVSRLKRICADYSYVSVGRVIGVSHNTLRAWVLEKHGPRASRVARIEQVIGAIEAAKPAVIRRLTPRRARAQ